MDEYVLFAPVDGANAERGGRRGVRGERAVRRSKTGGDEKVVARIRDTK
jgi:hypothetical protein